VKHIITKLLPRFVGVPRNYLQDGPFLESVPRWVTKAELRGQTWGQLLATDAGCSLLWWKVKQEAAACEGVEQFRDVSDAGFDHRNWRGRYADSSRTALWALQHKSDLLRHFAQGEHPNAADSEGWSPDDGTGWSPDDESDAYRYDN
jgi:hypothetical protein